MSSSRRQYPFHLIEPKWQRVWEIERTFKAWNPGEDIPSGHPFALRHGRSGKLDAASLPPKLYILDMFPYPSGAGLHVGHPEGYTATDILARYRRAQGYNVLHPMGWDAFGLPAEQYAIRTGRHPCQTTEENVSNFRRQIQSLGFSYDWSREVNTTDPEYFKWTQWIFLRLYGSWFNPQTRRAEPLSTLEYPEDLKLPEERPGAHQSPARASSTIGFDPVLESARRAYGDSKRLAYVTEAPVWWCEALGTVLANEEVVDGRSEVGSHPVVRRPMRQWMLRITEYAERLLEDLELLDWSVALKGMQRNWIGRSEGAEVDFSIEGSTDTIRVFTTRPDTLFGATYLVLSPEHRLVSRVTTPVQAEAVAAYRASAASKSDLERTDLAKEKTGVFTGAHAVNPVNDQRIPIWIADYVLASYGTGAIMAVPAHDTRDLEFATHFDLPIVQVVQPPDPGTDWRGFVGDGIAINSAGPGVTIDGLPTPEAKTRITAWLESKGLGRKVIHYKLRDWLFSRQRYWGEPFPIVWKPGPDGGRFHEALGDDALPVLPPDLNDYKPTPEGEPPLARARTWVGLPDGSQRETNTMPQWAGSCWYYLRYLDPRNTESFCGTEAERYWMGGSPGNPDASTRTHPQPGVDLYVGGTEHAVLHLLYARFWHKLLFDLGYVSTPEPFHRLVNQGLILGEDGQKMSKSRGNVVNPDEILLEYGADAFRLYEMFMGPLQDSKPWSTKGVEGVYRFLGRVWRLFIDEQSEIEFQQASTTTAPGDQANLLPLLKIHAAIQDTPTPPTQLRVLHACIRKVTEDLEGFRFNTAISAMMVFVNEAITWPVRPAALMRIFLQLLAPFAPHLAEELWSRLHASLGSGSPPSLSYHPWPDFDPALLVEDTVEIPVQINGKLRDVIRVKTGLPPKELEQAALSSDKIRPLLEGKSVRKIIVLPGKLVNVVAG